MFTAAFASGGDIIKKIVEIVKDKEHIPEGIIRVTEGGMSIQSMDVSHVALVDIFIHPDAAMPGSYECNDAHQLGISFETFYKIFKCSTSIGTCILRYDPEENGDVLSITFEGGKKSSYEMKLLDMDSESLEVPEEITHVCQQEVDSADIQKILKDLAIFADDVNISRTGKKLIFASRGENADAKIETIVSGNYPTTISGTYSLKYLQWFAKAASLCDEAILAFDKNQPLLLQYEIQDVVRVKFFLAPKIGADDEDEDDVVAEEDADEDDVDD